MIPRYGLLSKPGKIACFSHLAKEVAAGDTFAILRPAGAAITWLIGNTFHYIFCGVWHGLDD
jgi:hypothetical protein